MVGLGGYKKQNKLFFTGKLKNVVNLGCIKGQICVGRKSSVTDAKRKGGSWIFTSRPIVFFFWLFNVNIKLLKWGPHISVYDLTVRQLRKNHATCFFN